MVIDVLTVDITQNDTTICAGDSLVLAYTTNENSSQIDINYILLSNDVPGGASLSFNTGQDKWRWK